MKNLNFKTVLTALLLVVCLSCSSDDKDATDGNGNSTNNSDSFVIAKVNGVDFEVANEFLTADAISSLPNRFTIEAIYNGNSRSISIGLINIESTGMYTSLTNPNLAFTSPDIFMIYSENNGEEVQWFNTKEDSSITITEFSEDYIAGTFQFTGLNNEGQPEKNITEGSFRVKKQILTL